MSQWIERTARFSRDCERCQQFITKGERYFERNGSDGHHTFCLPCGDKLAPKEKKKPLGDHREKRRKPHDPLLGPGHVTHGLGRMQG